MNVYKKGMIAPSKKQTRIGLTLILAIALLTPLAFFRAAIAQNITSQVVVDNASPTVDAVTLNGAGAITLNPNATATIYVNYTISDNNGCSDVFSSGSVAVTVFRSGITSSTCSGTQNSLNCYRTTTVSANSCSGVSGNATSSVDIYYFAQATDASSSFVAQNWIANVIATDGANASSGRDSSGVELNTLLAIAASSTSAINYGTVTAGSNTGSTNQIATTTNAGNASTTLRLRASQTLKSGSNALATSSQNYATTTFTYGSGATGTPLTDSDTTVAGFTLTAPVSTSSILQLTYWGLSVSSSYPTGTYTGTTVFSALFLP